MAKITDGSDTRKRTAQFIACAGDPAYFTDNFLTIDDTQGMGGGFTGTQPFRLWSAQTRLLWQFLKFRFIVILKARQLGISWICCAYALWHCLFQPGKTVLIASKGQNEANELLRRVGVLYERLPEWMKAELPQRIKDNTETQEWSNGSVVHSFSTAGGRTYTGSLAILDEFAHNADAAGLYLGLEPTINAGGQLIVLSTAKGIGNSFHRLWVLASSGTAGMLAAFLPYWVRPGRDAKWYEETKARSIEPDKIAQEYPRNPQEAFVASGRSRFAGAWISQQWLNVCEPIAANDLPVALRSVVKDGAGACSVFKLPIPGRRYVLGADVAEGLEKGDWSAAVLIDAETWEEHASLHGHWEPDVFADCLAALAKPYNAEIAVERNNHGHAVLATLKRDGVRNVSNAPSDGRPGWLTNLKTKPQAIDILAEALRDNLCRVHSQSALDEMQIYTTLDNGATSAPEGYHDDRVMSWAIAVIMARHIKGSNSITHTTKPSRPRAFA